MIALELLPPLFLLLLSLVVLISIFRRHAHRLPPSPVGLPIIGHFHLLSPLLHHSFRDLSLRWGPLFSIRLGSVPCVVVSSPNLAREFLRTNELSFAARIDSIAINRLTYGSAMAFAPFNAYWKFTRRLTTNELLSSRPISGFAPLRSRELRRFLRVLAEKSESGEVANLSVELRKLSNAVILQMVLGSDAAATGVDQGRVEEARAVVREVTKIFGEFNMSDFVWFIRRFDLQGFRKRIEDIFVRFDRLIEKVLGEREELRRKLKEEGKEGIKERDFLDVMLDHLQDQNVENVHFTRVHVKGMIMDLFTAATDTTAISIEWALSELINNPTVLEKAQKEIYRVVGKDRLVNELDVPNLPYIQAIVKETLRLRPAGPLITRKCIKECKVGEYVIPVGTMLVVNMWAIARDPHYWESPLEFRPERFLQDGNGGSNTGGIDVKGQNFELLPFGSGRRMCPGMNLSLQTLPAIIAAIIQCFDLKVAGESRVCPLLSMEEGPGITTPRLHELVCVPAARICSLPTILEHEL